MYSDLNASNYKYNNTFFNSEFEYILSKIIVCYNLMISDGVKLNNDENLIRDVLYLDYLNDNIVRNKIGLKNYYFDREIQEDRTNGRTDIRVISPNSFVDTSAYYIIECKRLDSKNVSGLSGLNAEYIIEGICRFTSSLYTTYYKTNGMIGFVVEAIDIDKNITSINALLSNAFPQANTMQLISHRLLNKDFDFSYYSIHNKNNNEIIIYHLMFDFQNNIH